MTLDCSGDGPLAEAMLWGFSETCQWTCQGVICMSLPMLEANKQCKLMVIFKGFVLQNAWISWVRTFMTPCLPPKLTNFAGKKAGKFTIFGFQRFFLGFIALETGKTGKLYFPESP